jgi:AP2 domain
MREVPVSGTWTALVDDEDYALVAEHTWSIHVTRSGNRYARCQSSHGRGYRNPCRLLMHTLLTGWPRVDHEDRNGLNNQRSNLREASVSQNLANQRAVRGKGSRFKGVAWSGWKWRADIRVDRKRTYLGSFSTEEAAAQAYDRAAMEKFGEFACTNKMLGLL